MASDTSLLQSSFFISIKCTRQVPLDFGPLAIESFHDGKFSRALQVSSSSKAFCPRLLMNGGCSDNSPGISSSRAGGIQ